MRNKLKYGLMFLFFLMQFMFYFCTGDDSNEYKYDHNRNTADNSAIERVDHFFFVGKWQGKESIYKYSFKDSSYSVFWYNNRKRVIELLYSDDLKYAFFLSANKLGKREGVSLISGLELYKIEPITARTTFIKDLGDAIQILASWIDINFELQITKFDMKEASQIDKLDLLFSPFGKLLKENVEKFNFIKKGYPKFTIRKPKLVSKSGVFGLTAKNDTLFLRIAGVEKDLFIDSSDQLFDDVRWINDDETVVFSTRKITGSGKEKMIKSSLFVYDLSHKKVSFKSECEGRMNFIIVNDFLIYDRIAGNKSSIVIIDLKSNAEIKKIEPESGCNLKSLIY